MAKSVHNVDVTVVGQQRLFSEVFAMGLEVVDTSDDERNCIIIVGENFSHGALLQRLRCLNFLRAE